jgi:hypothetical protein
LFLVPSTATAGEGALPGKWVDEVSTLGFQETLTIFSNGAYKSETAIVDVKALRADLEQDCRDRIRPKRPKVRCDEQFVDSQVAKMSKLFPQTYIGTYVTRSGRIEFTHGCAEEIRNCTPGSGTEAGIYFVEGDVLTIKLDGIRYKGKVYGGKASTYARKVP